MPIGGYEDCNQSDGSTRRRGSAQLMHLHRKQLFNATLERERSEHILTFSQRLPTSRWLTRRPRDESLLVQIGANSHQKNAADPDPGPACLRLGWRAVLIEPMPQAFAALGRRYSSSTNERVRLINAAICARLPRKATAAACDGGERRAIWFVDTSNATGNWGSNRSDARCLVGSGLYGWVAEIASLERQHLLRHSQLLHESRASERRCAACAQTLGRPLPRDCVAEMITKNLRSAQVPCLCLSRAGLGLDGASHDAAGAKPPPLATPRAVTLLVIDTEGHDLEVLRQWPFASLPAFRVVFEARHMSDASFEQAAEHLSRHGFHYVAGAYGSYVSEWHHIDAP